jgi:prephenate dehydrogenase
VVGWDADPANLAGALERGALDRAGGSLDDVLTDCASLALALPLPATLALLRSLAARPPAATLVFDVASLKLPVLEAAAGLPAFVGTHPIAGSERSGPAAADAALFRDRVWTYEPAAAEPARSAAVALIAATGARPVPVAAAEHDRLIALTSHLPQVVSTALAVRLGRELDEPEAAALCGPGMASMTRLAGSSWLMWDGIFAQNGQAVAQEVRSLAHILSEAAEALESGRAEWLERWFAQAARAVARLNQNAPGNEPR